MDIRKRNMSEAKREAVLDVEETSEIEKEEEKEIEEVIINDGVIELLVEKYKLLLEKSQAFLKIYPKLIKTGFILIFTVPILFMILMFTVNEKLIFLVLWIVSILAIAAYLIGIEYFYFYYKNLHEEFERARHPEGDTDEDDR